MMSQVQGHDMYNDFAAGWTVLGSTSATTTDISVLRFAQADYGVHSAFCLMGTRVISLG